MSLAILPSSPMSYGQAPMPALLPSAPSPAKRPKLSLNTSTTPQVYGKGSTSLRLETLSATSPTGRNTFRNGYGQDQSKPRRPTLTPLATVQNQTSLPSIATPSKTLTPLVTFVAPERLQPATPLRTDPESPADPSDFTSSSAASISSTSTLDSLSGAVPYQLAYNITSILSNGPIPRPSKPNRTSFAQSRAMFPTPKKVTFRAPLTENISTSKYTMAHSDISSSSSTISTLELSPPEKDDSEDTKPEETQCESTSDVKDDFVAVKEPNPVLPRTGDKRESDEEDSDTCPATPVAGRRKKSRQWRWTLGPVATDPSSSSKEECSEDDEDSDVKKDAT